MPEQKSAFTETLADDCFDWSKKSQATEMPDLVLPCSVLHTMFRECKVNKQEPSTTSFPKSLFLFNKMNQFF